MWNGKCAVYGMRNVKCEVRNVQWGKYKDRWKENQEQPFHIAEAAFPRRRSSPFTMQERPVYNVKGQLSRCKSGSLPLQERLVVVDIKTDAGLRAARLRCKSDPLTLQEQPVYKLKAPHLTNKSSPFTRPKLPV